MFSSLETQGLRSDEQWGIWAIHPDGTNWGPLTSALGSPRGQAVHFQTQLSDESIVVESYYQTGSTDGFGTFWKFPMRLPEGQPRFLPAAKRFAPLGLAKLTLFASEADVRPNHKAGNVNNETFVGNVTHPSAAPDNHLLLVWSLPSDAQDQSTPIYDAGIYLMKRAGRSTTPRRCCLSRTIRNIRNCGRAPWCRTNASMAWTSRRGWSTATTAKNRSTCQPARRSVWSAHRACTSGRAIPAASCRPVRSRPARRVRAIASRCGASWLPSLGNWSEQGADAGLYENSDIWGIRIVLLEPVSDFGHRQEHRSRHFALVSNSEERLRILGEFPVRKFGKDGKQPLDPDGNPDTSFLAKIPADTALTFQTLDHNGMVLNMAQTWHQVRPGRNPQRLRRLPRPQPEAHRFPAHRRRQTGLPGLGSHQGTPAVHDEGQRTIRPQSRCAGPDRRAIGQVGTGRGVLPRCQADPGS